MLPCYDLRASNSDTRRSIFYTDLRFLISGLYRCWCVNKECVMYMCNCTVLYIELERERGRDRDSLDCLLLAVELQAQY